MKELKRPFHKMRKWICPKCGKVRMERKVKGKGERSRRLLTLLSLCLLILAGEAEALEPNFIVWTPSPLSRVFKDTKPPYAVPRGHVRIFLASAKGEWEPAQIAVHAPLAEARKIRTWPRGTA